MGPMGFERHTAGARPRLSNSPAGRVAGEPMPLRLKGVLHTSGGRPPSILVVLGPMGFEPMTLLLKGECSTPELRTQHHQRTTAGRVAVELRHTSGAPASCVAGLYPWATDPDTQKKWRPQRESSATLPRDERVLRWCPQRDSNPSYVLERDVT